MSDTAISSPTKPTKIAKGNDVTSSTRKLDVMSLNNMPERIFSNVCPATRLANSLTPNENARAT